MEVGCKQCLMHCPDDSGLWTRLVQREDWVKKFGGPLGAFWVGCNFDAIIGNYDPFRFPRLIEKLLFAFRLRKHIGIKEYFKPKLTKISMSNVPLPQAILNMCYACRDAAEAGGSHRRRRRWKTSCRSTTNECGKLLD